MSTFYEHISRLVPSLSREELADFVIAFSRKIPEELESTFLRELEWVHSCPRQLPASDANPAQLRKELALILRKLDDIEDGELVLDSELREDAWYCEDMDPEYFVFSDRDGVCITLGQAGTLLTRLLAAELTDEALVLTELLMDLSVNVVGDGELLEPLTLDDMLEAKLVPENLRFQILDGLYALYRMEPNRERLAALYEMLHDGSLSVSLKDILRGRDPDEAHKQRFLRLWIRQLEEDEEGFGSDVLVTEAVSLCEDKDEVLSMVRHYGPDYPDLYVWLLTPGNWSRDPAELLEAGEEILQNLREMDEEHADEALLCADAALRLGNQRRAEELWLEAFESEPEPLNLLRLVTESEDYGCYREQVEQLVYERNEDEDSLWDDHSFENTLFQMALADGLKLSFLAGDFQTVLRRGLTCEEYLGWSLTPVKECIDFMLLALDDSGEAPALGKTWAQVGDWLEFEALEYGKGLNQSCSGDGEAVLKRCLQRWKQYNPVHPLLRQAVMERLNSLLAKRTEAVVRGCWRNHYGECARWLAALGELQEAAGAEHTLNDMIDRYKARYPRHWAFHRELEAYRKR